MDPQIVQPTPKPKRAALAGAASSAASADLGRGGALLSLTLAWLFCLVAVFTVYLLAVVQSGLFARFAPAFPTAAADGLCYALIGVLAVFFVLPLFVGRVRMAGMIATGADPLPKAVFYYFSSPRAYGRGLAAGLLYLLSLALPIAPVTGAVIGAFALYDHVFSARLPLVVAVLLLVLLLLLCVGLALLCLYLSGLHFAAVALFVGNGELSLPRALRAAFACGRRRCGTVFLFWMDRAWRLILSLLTVGVLWVVYYAHQTALAYWHLTVALRREAEQKGESAP